MGCRPEAVDVDGSEGSGNYADTRGFESSNSRRAWCLPTPAPRNQRPGSRMVSRYGHLRRAMVSTSRHLRRAWRCLNVDTEVSICRHRCLYLGT
jgi:hypothetical protein